MRACFFLVDAIIAESPFTFIAELAAPVALIGKSRAAAAERTALKAVERVG